MPARVRHEIDHGRWLAQHPDTEKAWGWNSPAGRMRAQRRAEMISVGAGFGAESNVLEVGCGTGMFTEMFARSGARIMAVDISPDLLRIARDRGLPHDRVTFVEKPFEECDVEGPFDAIIGSSVLHHLDMERTLKKMFSLLNPGGVISFAEPNMLNPQVFLERKLSFIRLLFSYVSPDETAFIRSRLGRRLTAAGFEDVAIVPFDWLHPATPAVLIPLVSRVGALAERLPVLREFAGSLYIRARRPRGASSSGAPIGNRAPCHPQ